MLRALVVAAFLVPYVVLGTLVACAIAWLTGRPEILYSASRLGIGIALKLAGLEVIVEGRENLGDLRNRVVVSNHQSHLDPPVIVYALGDLRAVAKSEVFRIPFFRHVIRMAGFVELTREDPTRARTTLMRAIPTLQGGRSLLVFPEGTRTHTGEIGEFKKGGFVVAMEAGSQVVPVVVDGFLEAMPRGSVAIRPGVLRIRVLDPIDAGSYSYDRRDELMAEVRARMTAALADMRVAPPA